MQNARKACRSDAMKLCPGKRGNEAAACLRSNADKITAECKSALAKVPAPSGFLTHLNPFLWNGTDAP